VARVLESLKDCTDFVIKLWYVRALNYYIHLYEVSSCLILGYLKIESGLSEIPLGESGTPTSHFSPWSLLLWITP
jgi:hypothetical protein